MRADTPWRKIREFIPRSKRSLLSAIEANLIVRAVNCFLGMRAGKGIVIKRAEAGFVISLDPNSKGENTDDINDKPGAGGGASVNFRGEWNNTDNYTPGDVVWRASEANLAIGKGGTFLCTAANTNQEPPDAGTGTYSNAFWEIFAPFQAWHDFWIDPAGANGQTEVKGGTVSVMLDNTGTPNFVKIDKADVPVGVTGKTIKIREIVVCDAGVEKKMLVLGSETYT